MKSRTFDEIVQEAVDTGKAEGRLAVGVAFGLVMDLDQDELNNLFAELQASGLTVPAARLVFEPGQSVAIDDLKMAHLQAALRIACDMSLRLSPGPR